MNREAIAAALFDKVSAAYPWGSDPSRRVKVWGEVPPGLRPALFMSEALPESYVWTAQPNPKRTLGVRLFIYIDTKDASAVGAQQFNAILDALDAALAPPPGQMKQNLGGTCDNARIKGVPHRDPGDLDGDGILLVDIEIICP